MASDEVIAETKRQCELAIRALALDNCAVNIDLLKTDDGHIYMIELTGRVGATCLPELVALYFGIDYYEMIVKMAMGEDPYPIFTNRSGVLTANASRFLMAEKSGVLKEISNKNLSDDDIALMELYVNPGDKVQKFEDGKDRIGQIVVTGKDLSSCFRRLDEISDRITLIYEESTEK
ncbi:hypothetical protein DSECCO2_599000 [anaerobic digester metagenome]